MVLVATLEECHWNAIAQFITPKTLKKLVNNVDSDSREQFKRVDALVVHRVFTSLPVAQVIYGDRGSWCRLAADGYIPTVNHRVCTNERFGFIQRKQWVEWPDVCSVLVMRLYWQSITHDMPPRYRDEVYSVCQRLVEKLPGPIVTCDECKWPCPLNSMHTESTCCMCECTRSSGTLERFNGVSFVR